MANDDGRFPVPSPAYASKEQDDVTGTLHTNPTMPACVFDWPARWLGERIKPSARASKVFVRILQARMVTGIPPVLQPLSS